MQDYLFDLKLARGADPVARSHTLPTWRLAPALLVTARNLPMHLTIRVVNPAGQFATFAFESNTFKPNIPIPVGQSVIIPVGQWQSVTLGPGQSLYGRGSHGGDPPVVVSITGYPLKEMPA